MSYSFEDIRSISNECGEIFAFVVSRMTKTNVYWKLDLLFFKMALSKVPILFWKLQKFSINWEISAMSNRLSRLSNIIAVRLEPENCCFSKSKRTNSKKIWNNSKFAIVGRTLCFSFFKESPSWSKTHSVSVS